MSAFRPPLKQQALDGLLKERHIDDIVERIKVDLREKFAGQENTQETCDAVRDELIALTNAYLDELAKEIPRYFIDDSYVIAGHTLVDTRYGPVALFIDLEGRIVERQLYRSRRIAKRNAPLKISLTTFICNMRVSPVLRSINFTTVVEK